MIKSKINTVLPSCTKELYLATNDTNQLFAHKLRHLCKLSHVHLYFFLIKIKSLNKSVKDVHHFCPILPAGC